MDVFCTQLQRVTLETAKKLPKNYDEMGNDILLSMAVMGDQEVGTI